MGQYENNLLDIAWRRIQCCQEGKRHLEIKASFVLTANGLILGFLATAWSSIEPLLAFMSAAISIISLLYCMSVLRIRTYPDFDLKEVWGKFGHMYGDEDKLKQQIYSNLAKYEESYREINENMATHYDRAGVTFIIGVGFLALSLAF